MYNEIIKLKCQSCDFVYKLSLGEKGLGVGIERIEWVCMSCGAENTYKGTGYIVDREDLTTGDSIMGDGLPDGNTKITKGALEEAYRERKSPFQISDEMRERVGILESDKELKRHKGREKTKNWGDRKTYSD